MRTLTLMRHAKSDWTASVPGDAAVADKARPLSRRGKRDAPMMAAWMTARDLDPELIICSTAVRTRQTLGLLQKTVDPERQIIQLRDDLYLADADDLVEIIRSVSRKVRHVMVLGHDPGLHDTALLLIGAGEAQLRHALTLRFPTAGVAVIDFDLDRWSNLSPGTGTLRHFMAPKRLPQD